MSVGNQTQAVDFNKEQLTLVLGENLDQGGDDSGSRNGTGKTTIINALSYALYGQALTNIKRNNLINKTNSKGMLVTLHFEKDGQDYRIERGRSPNVLKFFINNHEQDLLDESQGDSRKTQEFINDLLGITILSEKADNLKEQVKTTKDSITTETLKIEAIQSANEKIESTIENLRKNQRAWNAKNKQDLEKLTQSIEELEHLDIDAELEAHEKLANWTEMNNAILALNKEKSTLESALLRATKSVEKAEKDIANLEDATCYTCGQALHDDKKEEIQSRKTKELNDALAYQTEVAGKLEEVLKGLNDIGNINGRPSTFYESMKEAYDHRSNVDNLRQTLENKKQDKDPYEEQILELQNTAMQEIDWTPVNELTNYKEHQEFLLKLLTNKDSFIRKKIIDQNLAYLNNRLTHYLDKLGLPHQVIFQNDLNVEITQLGQDLDFDNLSRGERNRLILGMSFAFRDVWESLYQNINLLFIDELIDSGMDTAGVEGSLAVIKRMGRERHKNVFLISHKDELVGRVNHVMKVIKENGFTSYENDIEIVE